MRGRGEGKKGLCDVDLFGVVRRLRFARRCGGGRCREYGSVLWNRHRTNVAAVRVFRLIKSMQKSSMPWYVKPVTPARDPTLVHQTRGGESERRLWSACSQPSRETDQEVIKGSDSTRRQELIPCQKERERESQQEPNSAQLRAQR